MIQNGDKVVLVETKPCMVCGERSQLRVSAFAFYQWQCGMLIQNAFPEMSADDRELLKSGTHPKCWDRMTKE